MNRVSNSLRKLDINDIESRNGKYGSIFIFMLFLKPMDISLKLQNNRKLERWLNLLSKVRPILNMELK